MKQLKPKGALLSLFDSKLFLFHLHSHQSRERCNLAWASCNTFSSGLSLVGVWHLLSPPVWVARHRWPKHAAASPWPSSLIVKICHPPPPKRLISLPRSIPQTTKSDLACAAWSVNLNQHFFESSCGTNLLFMIRYCLTDVPTEKGNLEVRKRGSVSRILARAAPVCSSGTITKSEPGLKQREATAHKQKPGRAGPGRLRDTEWSRETKSLA